MVPLRDRLPVRRPPYVNWLIIVANVCVFVWTQALLSVAGPRGAEARAYTLLMEYGLVPARLVQEPLAALPTMFSSMFMHDPSGWAHLGGNMLYLWIFGDNVEDAMGSRRYALFYVLCGMAAALAQVVVNPSSVVPMVGASGAISGVLAAYGSLYPRSPITVLNPILPLWLFFGLFLELPAWVIILEYFVVNLFSGLGSLGGTGGGVAFFAHLGGFVAGALLVRVFLRDKPPRDHDRWTQFRPPAQRPKSPYGPPYGAPPPRRPSGRDPWGW
ncbi:rhomboid family intramembrane serine protease [Polyangium sorediatum]|uniref:Rhomboid family intramembrane serine protease n=1 Tax=Polyangium sorediatum TaxID=889274 RepID=A0ABT6NUX8_9BACT|nr:rhomboid family intramembrane serine protease [Polyangium sorediatum]MDI1432127.1 rhomboid family intramembrane serine protease [Polyangium sorediatum]